MIKVDVNTPTVYYAILFYIVDYQFTDLLFAILEHYPL